MTTREGLEAVAAMLERGFSQMEQAPRGPGLVITFDAQARDVKGRECSVASKKAVAFSLHGALWRVPFDARRRFERDGTPVRGLSESQRWKLWGDMDTALKAEWNRQRPEQFDDRQISARYIDWFRRDGVTATEVIEFVRSAAANA